MEIIQKKPKHNQPTNQTNKKNTKNTQLFSTEDDNSYCKSEQTNLELIYTSGLYNILWQNSTIHEHVKK